MIPNTLGHQQLDNIVCIGHPPSTLLRLIKRQAINAKQVTFICPHPDLVEFVKRRLPRSVAFKIIPKVVTDKPDSHKYHLYSLPEWSSSLKFTGLSDTFPSLNRLSSIEASSITLPSLIQVLSLTDQQSNALILNGNEDDHRVLDSLSSSERACFEQLIIRKVSDALYSGSIGFSSCKELLEKRHYKNIYSYIDDANARTSTYQSFYFDTAQAQLSQLTASLEQKNIESTTLKQSHDKLEQKLAELQERLGIATQEKEQQTKFASEHLKQLAQLKLEKDQQSKLANEHLKQLEQLKLEKDQQSKLASGHLKQLEQLKLEKDQQSKLANEHLKQLEQTNKTKDEQAKLAQQRLTQISELEKRLEETEHRQVLFSEEMARAEAQIELIKDLLSRESSTA